MPLKAERKQSKALLGLFGLPVTGKRQRNIADPSAIGRPERSSDRIPHKTEAKAIRLGVSGDVRQAYEEVIAAAK
jgi:hypothetical protein